MLFSLPLSVDGSFTHFTKLKVFHTNNSHTDNRLPMCNFAQQCLLLTFGMKNQVEGYIKLCCVPNPFVTNAVYHKL